MDKCRRCEGIRKDKIHYSSLYPGWHLFAPWIPCDDCQASDFPEQSCLPGEPYCPDHMHARRVLAEMTSEEFEIARRREDEHPHPGIEAEDDLNA